MKGDPSRDSEKSLRVLVVGSDPPLEEEFRSALGRVPDRQSALFFAATYREAVDLATRRQPHLVVIEVDRDIAEIAALTRDLQELVPDAALAATFAQDRLDQGQSEVSTVIELMRMQIRDFIRRPVSTTELRATLDRLFSRTPTAAAAQQGRVVSFLSNKGGVGKSTLAVNVACALALRHPDDVLLIDTSLQFGACAMLLDLKPTTSIADAAAPSHAQARQRPAAAGRAPRRARGRRGGRRGAGPHHQHGAPGLQVCGDRHVPGDR